jgi:hypothetical protein
MFQVRVLVLHCRLSAGLSHDAHYQSKVAGALKHFRSKVVPTASKASVLLVSQHQFVPFETVCRWWLCGPNPRQQEKPSHPACQHIAP